MITLFVALIWKASKTYNDIKFCKEAKTLIVVDIWLNSSSSNMDNYLLIFKKDLECYEVKNTFLSLAAVFCAILSPAHRWSWLWPRDIEP